MFTVIGAGKSSKVGSVCTIGTLFSLTKINVRLKVFYWIDNKFVITRSGANAQLPSVEIHVAEPFAYLDEYWIQENDA